MEHIISVLVENKFGVLARVAGLFSARGYNIESLSVAPTLDPTTSMITIVTVGDDRIIEQIMKQLNKVVEVAGLERRVLAVIAEAQQFPRTGGQVALSTQRADR